MSIKYYSPSIWSSRVYCASLPRQKKKTLQNEPLQDQCTLITRHLMSTVVLNVLAGLTPDREGNREISPL